MSNNIKSVGRTMGRWIDKFFRDDLFTLSAALSFYTALSLAPLMVLCLTLFASFSDYMHNELILQISALVGPSAGEALKMIITNIQDRPDLQSLAGWWSAATLFVSASVAFGQLKEAMNRIFEVTAMDFSNLSFGQTAHYYLKDRLLNIGIVLTFLFMTLVSLIFSSAVTLVLSRAAQLLGLIGEMIISGLIFWSAFTLIYKWMPRTPVPWRAAFRGALFTGIAFGIGKLLIGLYLGNTAVSSAYGAAGSLMVLLVWVYYSSLIIFVGAEVSFLAKAAIVRKEARAPLQTSQIPTKGPASSSVRQSDPGPSSHRPPPSVQRPHSS